VRTHNLTREDGQLAFSNLDTWVARSAYREEITTADVDAANRILRRLDVNLRTPDAIHIAIGGDTRYVRPKHGHERPCSRHSGCDALRIVAGAALLAFSRFALPARGGLLPIGKRVAGIAGAAPAAAGRFDHVGVVAVEEVEAACVGPQILGFDAVDEHQYRGAVGVFLTVRQPDRLQGRMAVGYRAVRQEGRFLVGPQRCAKIFGALDRPRPDDDPVALGEGPLEELG